MQPGWLALQPAGERVRFCDLRQQDGKACLAALRDAPIVDLPALRRELQLNTRRCITLMPAGQYALVQVEAPPVPRAEWNNALRWQLKDLVPYPVEETVFDVVEIPTEAFAPGRQQQCFVIAANKQDVLALVAPVVDARIHLSAVDIPEMAQRNVAALFEEENRAVAFLSLGEDGALLTVTFHGELYGTRRIEVSLAQLAGADEFRQQQLLERIALETQRTLDAFDRQYSFMTVTRLILAAPTSQSGLRETLANNLYIPVVPMDLASVIDLSAVPELADADQQLEHLLGIGAALREEGAA